MDRDAEAGVPLAVATSEPTYTDEEDQPRQALLQTSLGRALASMITTLHSLSQPCHSAEKDPMPGVGSPHYDIPDCQAWLIGVLPMLTAILPWLVAAGHEDRRFEVAWTQLFSLLALASFGLGCALPACRTPMFRSKARRKAWSANLCGAAIACLLLSGVSLLHK